MKEILIFFLLALTMMGCQSEKDSKVTPKEVVQGQVTEKAEEDCDSEDKVKKKLEEDLKKSEKGEALSLQGDTGCSLDDPKH